ncbi:hypothetical protein [Metabacillus bambusae]|uniref:HTH psq-type domain-containing protein n=1 Tax=Metabacillus bambusae TaxID=2795218 RepID=A0ABS3NB46_9BACI|nr:hypothetical protein [Metabacillus bambusae]MBO1515497.1 hypothetical protein [Metabacillus bambusae]
MLFNHPPEFYKNRNTPEYRGKLSAQQTGMLNHRSKLTDHLVIEIRKEYNQAILTGKSKFQTQKILAEKYNVKRPTISDIVLRKTWIHI